MKRKVFAHISSIVLAVISALVVCAFYNPLFVNSANIALNEKLNGSLPFKNLLGILIVVSCTFAIYAFLSKVADKDMPLGKGTLLFAATLFLSCAIFVPCIVFCSVRASIIIVLAAIIFLLSTRALKGRINFPEAVIGVCKKNAYVFLLLFLASSIAALTFSVCSTSKKYSECLESLNSYEAFNDFLLENSTNTYLSDTDDVVCDIAYAFSKKSRPTNISVSPLVMTDSSKEASSLRASLLTEDTFLVSGSLLTENDVLKALKSADIEAEVECIASFFASKASELKVYSILPYTFLEDFYKGDYDSLFLSQISKDCSDVSLFNLYLATNPFSPKETPSLEKLSRDLDNVSEISWDIDTVWLFLDPFSCDYSSKDEKTVYYLNQMRRAIDYNREVSFRILLNYPNALMWNDVRVNKATLTASYKSVVDAFSSFDNVEICFPGSEKWIIVNDSVNSIENGPSAENNYVILGKWMDHAYSITSENFDEVFAKLNSYCEEYTKRVTADLSKYSLVFFGDSIFGYYRGPNGVSRLTAQFCNTEAINCAVSGATGRVSENDFQSQVNEYFSKDYKKGSIYLVNFGINDFIGSSLLTGAGSYYESMKRAIEDIQQKDPLGIIVLCTPFYYYNGLPYDKNEPHFSSYVDICKQLAKENDCYLIDTIEDFGLTDETIPECFYTDWIHLNENGRLLFASTITKHLKEWFE